MTTEFSPHEAAYMELAESSARWMSSADNLLAGAGLLWRAMATDLESPQSSCQVVGQHADIAMDYGESPPFLQHASVFLMLSGFAVENALKAVRVRQLEGGVTTTAVGGPRIADRLRTHDLQRLAADAGMHLSVAESELLARLEAYLIWAGRYPVATSARGQLVVQNLWSSDHERVTQFIERVRLAYHDAGGRDEA